MSDQQQPLPEDPADRQKLWEHQQRLRPQIARIEGVNLFMQATQDITVGGRQSRGSFQYTLQDADIPELVEWSQKMLEKMRALPQIADPSSDLFAMRPISS